METCKIYLAGAMSGLSLDEQLRWRNVLINDINYYKCEMTKNPLFFNPPKYYSPSTESHKSEREVMEYELDKLRKSDLMIVKFTNPNSIGTAMEIAVAREHRIPIIGWMPFDGKKQNQNNLLHPWILESCTRICENIKEVTEYVLDYYLK